MILSGCAAVRTLPFSAKIRRQARRPAPLRTAIGSILLCRGLQKPAGHEGGAAVEPRRSGNRI
jgi:hypothetical protein